MEAHLDRVRADPQVLRDLRRGQIGAVAEGDQLAITLVELLDRGPQLEPANGFLLDLTSGVRELGRRLALPPGVGLADATAGDSEQLGDRGALLRVVPVPVADRALERLADDVLGVGPVAETVGGVRVDAPDQRLWLGKWIAGEHGGGSPGRAAGRA